MSRSSLERLRDALDHCEHVTRLASGVAAADLRSDRVRLQALLYDLIILGTTFAHTPPEIMSLEPRIPWKEIIRTRNRFVHVYWELDPDFIMELVNRDLPLLAGSLRQLIATLKAQAD